MTAAADTPLFPAVIIGGPPHSGKSVFVYNLTRLLRDRRVPHYVLRAAPDGEGDWANEADQALVREIRSKGAFSRDFMDAIARRLQARHLPLLVDVGGKPTPWQAAVFAHCSHAVLLIGDRADDPDAFARDLKTWRAIMSAQGVPLLAELRSQLDGRDRVAQTAPLLTGTITGLERGKTVDSPTLSAVADRLQRLFTVDQAAVARHHLSRSPTAATVDIEAEARRLGAADGRWTPAMLPALAASVPAQTPLAVYGRGPNWVYALLAAHALPAPVWLFDARLGWVQPPALPLLESGAEPAGAQPGWSTTVTTQADYATLNMQTTSQLLDLERPQTLPLRRPPTGRGLVLNGRVPHWLLMAAVRQLAPAAAWTAVFQPPLGGAVVVASQETAVPPGHLIEIQTNKERP